MAKDDKKTAEEIKADIIAKLNDNPNVQVVPFLAPPIAPHRYIKLSIDGVSVEMGSKTDSFDELTKKAKAALKPWIETAEQTVEREAAEKIKNTDYT